MANLNVSGQALRQQVSSALDLVVQAVRLPDGTRKVIAISELTGMEGPMLTMQELFTYERQGFDEEGKVKGDFHPTGIRPKFSDKLFAAGIRLPMEMFSNEMRA